MNVDRLRSYVYAGAIGLLSQYYEPQWTGWLLAAGVVVAVHIVTSVIATLVVMVRPR